MNRMTRLSVAYWILNLCLNAAALDVKFNVNLNDALIPISPAIFGTNAMLTGTENWAAYRLGGNRLTGYNWENNYSNAGSDWYNQSDTYMITSSGIPQSKENVPAIATTTFHDKAIRDDAYSLVTLQMAGYVARDKNGTVTEVQTAPSSRWCEVKFEKGSAFSLQPDLTDSVVYMDEYVHSLINKYGTVKDGDGIRGFCLDNEPDLWADTHPRIHPQKASCREIILKSVALSKVIKTQDPDAEIFGPVSYGFGGYNDFQGAPDWGTVKSGKDYAWFIDYYLDEMRNAESSAGKRLLDVLALNWYSEAQGDHRITENDATTAADQSARVQAPRTLWDPNYAEKSWIAQWFRSCLPLLPKVKASINKYYPGTKLAFTEISYGGGNHITGAIATADFLGIFAKYGVYLATLWPTGGSEQAYTSAAYKMYRNVDGKKSTFGNYYAPSITSDSLNSSIYGSIRRGSTEIHLIVINKHFTEAVDGQFTITTDKTIKDGRVWLLDKSAAQIQEVTGIGAVTNNAFTYRIPAASICHILLRTTEPLTRVDAEKSDRAASPPLRLSTYPNPLRSSYSDCRIQYVLPKETDSRLVIYDIMGRTIKAYDRISGSGTVFWDGNNGNSRRVSSGIYYAVLRNGNQTLKSGKILLLR